MAKTKTPLIEPLDGSPDELSRLMAQLGRRGGRIGGKRRLQTMTPQARRKVARHAARARWNKQR